MDLGHYVHCEQTLEVAQFFRSILHRIGGLAVHPGHRRIQGLAPNALTRRASGFTKARIWTSLLR